MKLNYILALLGSAFLLACSSHDYTQELAKIEGVKTQMQVYLEISLIKIEKQNPLKLKQ